MSATTVANQKMVRVHKPHYTRDFLTISNAEWMQANKLLTPYGLQLYLYLAANADGFLLALSPEAAEQAAGIARTTFYKFLKLLEIYGYLVWRGGNVYDFFTTPVPEDKRTHPDKHKTSFEASSRDGFPDSNAFAGGTPPSLMRTPRPQSEPICSPQNIEIYNKYETDGSIDKGTNNAGETPAPPASPAADAAFSPTKAEDSAHTPTWMPTIGANGEYIF